MQDSCGGGKVVGLFQKWYDFSESGTTFSCISHSRVWDQLSLALACACVARENFQKVSFTFTYLFI